MKFVSVTLFFCVTIIISCNEKTEKPIDKSSEPSITGTWKLITGTIIEKGDTVITEYTNNRSFIKILNNTHFAFMQHDLNKGNDSIPVFGAGGGTYTIAGDSYTEHLEYCSDRSWEGHDFTFTIKLQNDTLTQSGEEKIESEGINRINIEKYVRLK